MSAKVWDVTAPTDNWGRGYARLAWLAVGVNRALSTRIEVTDGAEEESTKQDDYETRRQMAEDQYRDDA